MESRKKFWLFALFKRRNVVRRLFLGLFFSLSLSFFLHYRAVSLPNLELNSMAKEYVLAKTSFSFPDVEATQLLRQEAVRDVGMIYRIDEQQIAEEKHRFEKEMQDGAWRDRIQGVTFDELYLQKELFFEHLLESRFIDERTEKKLLEIGSLTPRFVLFHPESGKVAVLPREVMEIISGEKVKPVAEIFQAGSPISWRLEEDLSLQNGLRHAVKNRILLKASHVEAGSRIIDAGEIVTGRHLEMMKALKKAILEESGLLNPVKIAGSLFMALFLTLLGALYLRQQHRLIFQSFSKLALLATVMVFTLALAKIGELSLIDKTGSSIDTFGYPLFVPLGTVLLAVLFNRELALLASGCLSLVLGVTLAVEYDHFFVINLVGVVVALLEVRKARRRKDLFELFGKVWLACIPVIFAFHLYETGRVETACLSDVLMVALYLLISSVIAVGILPILETLFGVVTDMTLMEFVDPNHPLLRRLSMEAPGTYHHSLVVGSLAESAATAIGANSLFCWASALYHDIGKLENSQYFTENQSGGFNIHSVLTPLESVAVILSHVTEGVVLARKYGLPQKFIDVIREHHGTSVIRSFYHAQVVGSGGDASLVEAGPFSYKGPKPSSKESAIVMIADIVEAAFRSEEELSEEKATALVERLVQEKVAEGQFDECRLTFAEFGIVKRVIARTLLATKHSRVRYPEKIGESFSKATS